MEATAQLYFTQQWFSIACQSCSTRACGLTCVCQLQQPFWLAASLNQGCGLPPGSEPTQSYWCLHGTCIGATMIWLLVMCVLSGHPDWPNPTCGICFTIVFLQFKLVKYQTKINLSFHTKTLVPLCISLGLCSCTCTKFCKAINGLL